LQTLLIFHKEKGFKLCRPQGCLTPFRFIDGPNLCPRSLLPHHMLRRQTVDRPLGGMGSCGWHQGVANLGASGGSSRGQVCLSRRNLKRSTGASGMVEVLSVTHQRCWHHLSGNLRRKQTDHPPGALSFQFCGSAVVSTQNHAGALQHCSR
jgi:hypothetical protein